MQLVFIYPDLPEFAALLNWMQVFQPWIQKRKIAYAMHKRVMSGILKQLKTNALGNLIDEEGKPNTIVIEQFSTCML